MINQFLKDNIEILIGLITTIVAFFSGKKSKQIEEKKANADALQGIQNVYEKFVEQTEKKFDSMEKEIVELKKMLNQYINQCSKCENNKLK